ncbi:MAG: hypothetical protein Q8O92_13920, partial [Candidatus Latescibacter sp.]|nr:hypothetical protein [Candidatus Latescibacter sp.]
MAGGHPATGPDTLFLKAAGIRPGSDRLAAATGLNVLSLFRKGITMKKLLVIFYGILFCGNASAHQYWLMVDN